jgi:D-sedoheptulose 7-phosphate isomerase
MTIHVQIDTPLKIYLKKSADILEDAIASFDDDRVNEAISVISETLKSDRPLLVCGNGGSAADAQHITGELVGRFLKERKALNAICLSSNVSVITAWSNDYSFDEIFARQVEAHVGSKGGALLAISTSGNSPNIVAAALTANRLGIPVISLTGKGGGKLGELSDILLDAPSTFTPLIQQVHICLYHYICEQVERICLNA